LPLTIDNYSIAMPSIAISLPAEVTFRLREAFTAGHAAGRHSTEMIFAACEAAQEGRSPARCATTPFEFTTPRSRFAIGLNSWPGSPIAAGRARFRLAETDAVVAVELPRRATIYRRRRRLSVRAD
jgi:hypothetical protein